MNIQHLVSMANDISAFFDGEVGTQEAPASVALHITRYWDPRMRSQIIAHATVGGRGSAHQPWRPSAHCIRRQRAESSGIFCTAMGLSVSSGTPSSRPPGGFELAIRWVDVGLATDHSAVSDDSIGSVKSMPRMRLSRRSLLGSVGAASITPSLPAAGFDTVSSSPDLPHTTPAFDGSLIMGPQQRVSQVSRQILGSHSGR